MKKKPEVCARCSGDVSGWRRIDAGGRVFCSHFCMSKAPPMPDSEPGGYPQSGKDADP